CFVLLFHSRKKNTFFTLLDFQASVALLVRAEYEDGNEHMILVLYQLTRYHNLGKNFLLLQLEMFPSFLAFFFFFFFDNQRKHSSKVVSDAESQRNALILVLTNGANNFSTRYGVQKCGLVFERKIKYKQYNQTKKSNSNPQQNKKERKKKFKTDLFFFIFSLLFVVKVLDA
ncbi:hypothetical protein RFI_38217, partial [Reticulomyxa filosa]